MGTRADFYVGTGSTAEWLGSVGWDGYEPNNVDISSPAFKLRHAADETIFRENVAAFFKTRDDVTFPEQGWPWPWPDSRTTDYAYCFNGKWTEVYVFGHRLIDSETSEDEKSDFPNMTARQNVTFGNRSGLMFVSS